MPGREDVVGPVKERCFDLGAGLRTAVAAPVEILWLDSVLHLTSESMHGC